MAPLLQVKDLSQYRTAAEERCVWSSDCPSISVDASPAALRRDEGTGSALFANVSFEVNEGDIIVIKGRSGSG